MSLCDDLNCPAVLAAIDQYLDNELTIEDHARVSSHLENCPKCVAHADLERTLKESVQRCCQDTAPDARPVRAAPLPRLAQRNALPRG